MQRTTEAVAQELLVLRCRRGDKAALEELVQTWDKRLFYFVRRLVDDEADAWDVLQQTWMRMLSGIRGLREADRLGPWLYRIARHAALNHGKVRARYREVLQHYPTAPAEDDSSHAEFENAEQVHHGLLRLPLPFREVLTLLFLENFSVDAIAEILDVPAGTVKSRLHHAKKALRAVLEKEA